MTLCDHNVMFGSPFKSDCLNLPNWKTLQYSLQTDASRNRTIAYVAINLFNISRVLARGKNLVYMDVPHSVNSVPNMEMKKNLSFTSYITLTCNKHLASEKIV